MTRRLLRHGRWGTAVLLGAIVILLGLADAAAHEARRVLHRPYGAVELFPGFTAEQLPRPGHGLVVTSLKTASEAQREGITVGDEILAIDRQPVTSLKQAERVLKRHPQSKVALQLLHNDIPRDVTLHQVGAKRHGT